MSGTPAIPRKSSPQSRTYPHWIERVCHRPGCAARDERSEGGFTLIEVAVSFGLLMVVGAAAVTGIVNALQTSHVSQQRVLAANVGQQDVATDLAGYQSAGTVPRTTSYTTSVGAERFTVSRSVSFNTGGATACAPGSSFTVHVRVSQAPTGKFLSQIDTVIAC